MKVWLVQIAETIPLEKNTRLMRTARLAKILSSHNHDVTWWTSAFDHMNKKWLFNKTTAIDVQANYKIIAVKGLGYKSNVSILRFLDHKILAIKYRKLIKKIKKPDVMIINTPDHNVAYVFAEYAVKNNIPYVLDIRDAWPDDIVNNVSDNMLIRKIVKACFYLSGDYKKIIYCINNASKVTSMMDYLLQWAEGLAKKDLGHNKKIFYLGADELSKETLLSNKLQFLEQEIVDKKVILYVGTMGKRNDPVPIIEVAEILEKNSPGKYIFLLAGDGPRRALAEHLGKNLKSVKFVGWVNDKEIAALLSIANLAVMPASEIFEAIPNKVFTYLSGGLPIISNIDGECRKFIENYNVGWYIPIGKAKHMADLIKSLFEINNDDIIIKSDNSKKIFYKLADSKIIDSEFKIFIENIVEENNVI